MRTTSRRPVAARPHGRARRHPTGGASAVVACLHADEEEPHGGRDRLPRLVGRRRRPKPEDDLQMKIAADQADEVFRQAPTIIRYALSQGSRWDWFEELRMAAVMAVGSATVPRGILRRRRAGARRDQDRPHPTGSSGECKDPRCAFANLERAWP